MKPGRKKEGAKPGRKKEETKPGRENEENDETLYDRTIKKFKNHKLIVIGLVLLVVVGGVLTNLNLVLDTWDRLTNKETKKTNETSTKPKPKAKTLKERFESDFGGKVLSLDDEHEVRFTPYGSKTATIVKINHRAHFDLDSRAKYLSFYIPRTLYTDQFCLYTLGQTDSVFAYAEQHVRGKYISLGEREMDMKNLKFSGRSFIYHETHLEHNVIDELTKVFEQQGIFVQFRGPEYEVAQNLYEAN